MNIFKKALTWFKANNRKIEKITLLVGSLILLGIGLFYNIYADIALNISVGYLIFGLLTTIAGGTLMLVGLYLNLFDVNYKGLALVTGGYLLSIFNIFIYKDYLNSEYFIKLIADSKPLVTVAFNIMEIASIVAVVIAGIGLALQVYQRVIEFKDVKVLVTNSIGYLSVLSIVISLFIELCLTDVAVFKLVGMLKHTWISLLFLPLPVISLFVVIFLRNDKINFKVNAILTSSSLAVLLLIGLAKPLTPAFSVNSNSFEEIRSGLSVELPEKLDIVSIKQADCEIIYGKIVEENFTSTKTWQTSSDSDYDRYLPLDVVQVIDNYEYFYFEYTSVNNTLSLQTNEYSKEYYTAKASSSGVTVEYENVLDNSNMYVSTNVSKFTSSSNYMKMTIKNEGSKAASYKFDLVNTSAATNVATSKITSIEGATLNSTDKTATLTLQPGESREITVKYENGETPVDTFRLYADSSVWTDGVSRGTRSGKVSITNVTYNTTVETNKLPPNVGQYVANYIAVNKELNCFLVVKDLQVAIEHK